MRYSTYKKSILAMSAAAALLTAPMAAFAQAPAAAPAAGATVPTVGNIRGNSALLSIDPALVEGGKSRIAKMDATRIQTGRGGDAKMPGYKIIGDTYSVGTANATAYLIKTTDGLILLDTTWERTTPWVVDNIKALGFNPADIKVILGSHSHGDHIGGMALIKTLAPNAKLYVMDADAPIIERGTPNRNGAPGFSVKPAKVDVVVKDGAKIALGETMVTAWKTAGHTPGATSYEWKQTEGGKTYNVVLVGSQQAAENLIPGTYPGIADDQVLGWTRLLSLRADVWMGGHPWQHDDPDKYNELVANPKVNPYIDPLGYKELIAARAYDFVLSLRKQQAAAGMRPTAGPQQ